MQLFLKAQRVDELKFAITFISHPFALILLPVG
jgi:hypothetical protein